MRDFSPSSCADFGSGQGSLISAIDKRWPNLTGYTVEIDEINIKFLKKSYPKFQHIRLDITDLDFPEKFISKTGGILPDLVISNPPYMSLDIKENLRSILKEVDLLSSVGLKNSIPSELIFMIQSSRLSPDIKISALILPDYLISASKNHYIRRFMIDKMGLYKVIEIGKKAFRATDVKTHIAYFDHQRAPDKIEICAKDNKKSIFLNHEDFIVRGDYAHYNLGQDITTNKVSLGDIAVIERGNIPMYIAKREGIDVFHTTTFKNYNNKFIDLSNFETNRDLRYIRKGDIILGRVGRNILDHILIVGSGSANHSDCIIRISIKNNDDISSGSLLDQLTSAFGLEWLESRIKGSGAKSISIDDLKRFPVIIGGLK